MSYTLDSASAKQADTINSGIRDSGKYVGVITRAEALVSQNGTKGLGLSFKTTSGQTADYLDIYTHKKNGEELTGLKTVNALLACLKLRSINEGAIHCEKWNADIKKREQVQVTGYPELMNKPIGMLLQKELGTHSLTGADTEKMTVFGVFSASSELTASEILEGKTQPERLPKMIEALSARPVRDNRDKDRKPAAAAKPKGAATGTGFDSMDDDIPF